MAIAGALIASPAAHAAAKVPARATTIAEQPYTAGKPPARTATGAGQASTAARVPARATATAGPIYTDALVIHHEPARRYVVKPGDTLSSVAQRFYGSPARWRWLYQANETVIKNPNVIYPGEVLNVPDKPPARGTASAPAEPTALTTSTVLSGTLSCHGLENLWEQAGGPATQAVMAASIAMAESSGRQFATGPAGERGYWQIHPDHGSLSTYDPLGNARAAVAISGHGRNWTPWTTFTSGAYRGRC
jgi:LysM repeat protein